MKKIKKMTNQEVTDYFEKMDIRSRNRVFRILKAITETGSSEGVPYYLPEDDIDHG